MAESQNPLPHVHPFIKGKPKPPRKNGVDTRGMLSIATMLVSLAALSVAMFGAGRLVFDVFNDGGLAKNLDGMSVKLAVLTRVHFWLGDRAGEYSRVWEPGVPAGDKYLCLGMPGCCFRFVYQGDTKVVCAEL